MWDRFKASFKSSLTILWARIQVVIGLVIAALFSLLADPNVTGALQSILQPKYVPYYVIGIGLLTEIARRRTATKE